MAVEVTFLGHAGFLFSDGTHTVAVDPFLTNNPAATMKPEEISCQHIALSHGHDDHFGDTVSIAKRNNAVVYAAFELAEYVAGQGVAKCERMSPGGQVTTDFGFVALTPAFHSSSYQGRYMGQPCGVIVNIGGVTIYHCGDTGLFSDMKLIGEIYSPDIACIPIGDRFTMGPEPAARAAKWIGPKVAIPIHYGTWPEIEEDPADFKPKGVKVRIMQPGETWKYKG